jgi:hypothetical protein
MYSGLGSIDFAAAARSVLLAGEHNSSKVMAHVKSSLAPIGKSMNYTIVDSKFSWDGISSLTADDIRGFEPEVESRVSGSVLDEATEWLGSLLADDALAAKEVFSHASKEGISKATLKRAKELIGVQSNRHSEGNKGKGDWFWYLPGHEESAEMPKEDDVQPTQEAPKHI